MSAFIFPDIDPVAFHLGSLAIRWYGIAYLAGILLGWRYALWLVRKSGSGVAPQIFDEFIPWAVIGIVAGGRLGQVLFYNSAYYFQNPLKIFALWEPGMSFHGGLIGIVLSILWFCKRKKINPLAMGDIISVATTIGLFFGRLANFVNGELWGRPTEMPWGVIFRHVDPLPRHPSQLYEASLEGFGLFVLLTLISLKTKLIQKRPGAVFAIFLLGYSVSRIIIEFFKEPESYGDYFWWGTTRGQWLTLPLMAAALFILKITKSKAPENS